jgi:hypothetical protein
MRPTTTAPRARQAQSGTLRKEKKGALVGGSRGGVATLGSTFTRGCRIWRRSG